jgi:hypothetical protein
MNTNDSSGDKVSSSLLRYITPSQVDDLILEEKLRSQGYRFSYIVDPYDLSKYCYPFGITTETDGGFLRRKMTDNDKLDEQIAFDILFQDKKIIFYLLDEHLDEFYDFQLTIRESTMLGLELIDTNSKLIEKFKKYESIYESIELIKNIEETKINLIVSMAIGYLRSGLRKLEIVLKEQKRIITQEFEGMDNRVKELSELIKNTRPGELSDIISIETDKIAKVSARNELDYLNRRNNFKNDMDVIDRVLTINSKLISKQNNNELCLFLSSTTSSFSYFQLPRNSNAILRFPFNSINKTIKRNLPSIEDVRFNPHRSSSQIFLSFILDEEDKVKKIEHYLKFKNSIAVNFNHELLNIDKEFEDKFWIERIIKFREKSENLGLLAQIKKFKQTLKNALELHTVKSYKALYNAIADILLREDSLENIELLRDQNFRFYFYENTFKVSLDEGLRNLQEFIQYENDVNGGVFNLIKRGDDKIYGRYHFLPAVFNIKDKQVKDLLAYYVNFIFAINLDVDGKSIHDFYKNWLAKTVKILRDSQSEYAEMKLLRCLILLLLPGVKNQGKIVLNRIREVLDFEINKNEYKIRQEFYYLGAWAARRINDYAQALEFTSYGMEADPKDARFYHSKALISYCKASIVKFDESEQYLIDVLKNCKMAINYYSELEVSEEVEKSILALQNTFVYTGCLIWYKNFENGIIGEEIQELREILNNDIKKKEKNFKKLIEFLHTEAFLEYLEYHYYGKRKEYLLSSNKIYNAVNAIELALSLNRLDKDCLELQLIIHDAVNRLYSENTLS